VGTSGGGETGEIIKKAAEQWLVYKREMQAALTLGWMTPPDALRKAIAKFCHFHFGKINHKIKTPPESKGRLQVRRRFPGGERGCICAFQGRTRT
jgi:hypothetical protein